MSPVSWLLLPDAILFCSFQCRIRHAISGKRSRTVTACTADATRGFAALVAAPCQFIRHVQFQTSLHNICLCPPDKRRFNAQLFPAAEENRLIHCLIECIAAIRIGVAGSVIAVCAIKDDLTAVRQGNTCCRCQKQTVPERHIGGNRFSVGVGQLLRIALLRNLLSGSRQQRTVGVGKNNGQIQLLKLRRSKRQFFRLPRSLSDASVRRK